MGSNPTRLLWGDMWQVICFIIFTLAIWFTIMAFQGIDVKDALSTFIVDARAVYHDVMKDVQEKEEAK